MGKSGWFFWIAGWLLLHPLIAFSSPPESAGKVRVQASVDKEQGGVFIYSYSITNDLDDPLHLDEFALNVSLSAGAVKPPAAGLDGEQWKDRRYTEISSLSKIPIRLLAPNPRWPSYSDGDAAVWLARYLIVNETPAEIPPLNHIASGATLSGFKIASSGLPGIKKFGINPPDGPAMPEGEQRGPSFYGKTIGPTAVIEQNSPIRFSVYLKTLILEAESFGWIEGPGTIGELTRGLDHIRESIRSNEVESALMELAALLEKIKIVSGKDSVHGENDQEGEKERILFSPEGYALIRFNAEHLLGMLKERRVADETGNRKSLQETKIKADVSLGGARMFHYSYAVTNGILSETGISLFSIDLSRSPGGMRLDGSDLPSHSFSPRVFHPERDQPVPVGAFTPTGFMPLHNFLFPKIVWGYAPDQLSSGLGDTFLEQIGRSDGIAPGETVNGFELFSHGLPGIRDYALTPFFIKPRPPFIGSVIQPDEAESDAYARNYYHFEEKISVKGRTVGPTAPPEKLIPLDYLLYLADLKRQAQALEWLKGALFIDELDRKIRQVRERIQTADRAGAERELNTFIAMVETAYQKSEGVSPEGWALLKFNAEYLRDQLVKTKDPGADFSNKEGIQP